MLSVDSAAHVNGQAPPSTTNISIAPTSPLGMPISTDNVSAAATVPSTATAAVAATNGLTKHQIWLVTGPAGCGKSTVAAYLANSLQYSYIEGDNVGYLDSNCTVA
jgi:gluconokinase